MVDLVAKRYVKAIMSNNIDTDSLTNISNELSIIASAYSDNKFLLIISSTEVSNEEKINLILSFIDKISDTSKNLIKLLSEKKRLDIIPSIVTILNSELSKLNNSYTGVIYTNVELDDSKVALLNEQFSSKFNVNLVLSQNVCDYDGIKVDIDGLGIEIGFSKERLKSQMIEHILKAI
jgi:F-type H+-transporting ATPase subunit delta